MFQAYLLIELDKLEQHTAADVQEWLRVITSGALGLKSIGISVEEVTQEKPHASSDPT